MAAAPYATVSTAAIETQSSLFAVDFDARPTANGQAIVGVSNGGSSTNGALAAFVRFNTNGKIDVKSGTSFTALTSFSYTLNNTYRFRLIGDLRTHTYSVYVQGPTGSQVKLADKVAFNGPQASVTNLKSIVARSRIAGSVTVSSALLSTSNGMARVGLPSNGTMYHGVFPGGTNTWGDDITSQEVADYENAAGKGVAWVTLQDNWLDGNSRAFPTATANWIKNRGEVPYIRLETISDKGSLPSTSADPLFTMQNIINGKFDADFKAWAQGAKAYGAPVVVEWGTEVNGDWYPWNGTYAGGGTTTGFGDPTKPDGPERFAAAYRHIVQVMRGAGAENISFAFHVDCRPYPTKSWNDAANYYPGSDVIDWVGVSAYGGSSPSSSTGTSFRDQFDPMYAQLQKMAPEKPVGIWEFGKAVNSTNSTAQDWANAALSDLLSNRWANVDQFSWWNERWQNDSKSSWDLTVDSDFRIQDTSSLANVFKTQLSKYSSRVAVNPVLGVTTL